MSVVGLCLSVVALAVQCVLGLHYQYKGMDMEVRVSELTFELPDGATSCFYMKGLKGDPMTVEFEVIEGGHMDVDYTVKDATGNTLDSLTKAADGHFHVDDLAMLGDYELCFSNKMSHITHKKIFFRWTMGWELDDFLEDTRKNTNVEGTAEYQDLEYNVLQIRQELMEIENHLDHARNREHRHRATVDVISTRVWVWSMAITAVMIFVSVFQVQLIKGLFNTR